jgi:hypothetical protein
MRRSEGEGGEDDVCAMMEVSSYNTLLEQLKFDQ